MLLTSRQKKMNYGIFLQGIPLFEDTVIVIMGDLAITATKLNEQELMSAELCRQCCILNLLSLDWQGAMS